MSRFPAISFRQPQPFDIVPQSFTVCGLGAAFEGVVGELRVLDAHLNILTSAPMLGTGMGFSFFETPVTLTSVPSTRLGVIVGIPDDPSGEGLIPAVSVAVSFGAALLTGYTGFAVHVVKPGDTLSKIAKFYGHTGKASMLFDANRDILTSPNLIHVGQELRIPLG